MITITPSASNNLDTLVSLKADKAKEFEKLYSRFTVTTSSVVATATVKLEPGASHFRLYWGDGATSYVSTKGVKHGGWNGRKDDGSYELKHVYAAPEDREAFDETVVLRVGDGAGNNDLFSITVTVTPLYRVTHYPIFFHPISFEDWFFEHGDEWIITLKTINILPEINKIWKFDFDYPFRGFSGFIKLEDSTVSYDLKKGQSRKFLLKVFDSDVLWDDDILENIYTLSGDDEIQTLEYVRVENTKVKLHFRKSVMLLVPLPDNNDLPTLEML